MLNKIILQGRLGDDPELRVTPTGKECCTINLAVDRDVKDKDGERVTDWITVVAWGNTAKFIKSYFSKGRMAVVSGRLQIRSWTDKDGNKRRTAEVVADNVYFGDSKPEGSQGGYNAPATGYSAPAGTYGTGGQFGGYGGGYAASGGGDQYSANNFDMREDDESQLPF